MARSAFAVSSAQTAAERFYGCIRIRGDCRTVKQQIVEMTLNGSGIRDIARVLHVGPNTVMKELKKSVRPLAGEHKCSRGVLSRRGQGRSATRGSSGGR